jgi:hypothetical protein
MSGNYKDVTIRVERNHRERETFLHCLKRNHITTYSLYTSTLIKKIHDNATIEQLSVAAI